MRTWFFEQMAMYSAYHRDRRNQATHHVGVPMIVFSLLVLASTTTVATIGGTSVTLAALLMGLLLLAYIIAVPLVGVIAVGLYGTLTYFAEQIGQMGTDTVYMVFVSGFVGGWIIQFIGHAFEGRKPALFTNLTQIFMAPGFLIAEILFMFGLEKGLQTEIAARIDKYVDPALSDTAQQTSVTNEG